MIWKGLKIIAILELIALAIWFALIAYWFWESTDGRDEQ